MSLVVSVTDDAIFEVLGAFIESVLTMAPENVVQGQGNRVAEPAADDFVIMVPLRRERLSTNVDHTTDCAFIGACSGTVLTVYTMLLGKITYPVQFFGIETPYGSKITGQLSGTPGGAGTYSITPAQTTSDSAIGNFSIENSAIGIQNGALFACGAKSILQPTKLTIQLEVHGDHSADNAQIISTLMRDEYAYDFFQNLNLNISPLYADDPKQMPFSNEGQQVENRWVIECLVQANITVQIPQQFADRVIIGLINVDVEFPPS